MAANGLGLGDRLRNEACAKPVLVADADFLALIFNQLENILKKVENKIVLYCFCIYICITVIK